MKQSRRILKILMKILFIVSILLYVLILIVALYSAVMGTNTSFFSREPNIVYGFEAFWFAIRFLVYAYSVFIPILPVVLIYQILYVGIRWNEKKKIYLNRTEKNILEILKKDPYKLQNEIAEELNVKVLTVKRNMKFLKDKGIISRVGADKNGFWEVKKEKN